MFEFKDLEWTQTSHNIIKKNFRLFVSDFCLLDLLDFVGHYLKNRKKNYLYKSKFKLNLCEKKLIKTEKSRD